MAKARVGGVAAEQLRSIVQRVEKLREEQAAIGADIRDVLAEAKGNGFDVKAIRQVIKLRGMDAAAREEAEQVLHTYMHALGMQPDLFDEKPEGTSNEETKEESQPSASGQSLEAQASAYT